MDVIDNVCAKYMYSSIEESFPFPLQDLPFNLLNYGLYLLPSVPGKLGKYMDDGRFLGDYVFHGHVPRLEVSVGSLTVVVSPSLPSVMLKFHCMA